MVTVSRTAVTVSQRIKSMVIMALIVCSLAVGAAMGAPQASAAAPPVGAVSAQTQTVGPTLPPTGGTAEKPNGGKKPKKPTPQPPVTCFYFPQDEAIIIFGTDPGPGGFTNCMFTADVPKE